MRTFFTRGFAQIRIWVLVLLCGTTLTACVTTVTGGLGSKKDPDKALEYSLQLARSYIRDRNWDDAKRHLQIAMEIDDNSAEIYEALALVYQNTGELELARENYEKAIDIDPDSSRLRNNYAAFLYFMERYEEAAGQLERVVSDTLYRKRGLALMNLGRCYSQLGNWEGAEYAFRRALLMDRDNPALMYELANSHYELGNYARAQSLYDKYRASVKQQAARALWLGIRLAKKFDNSDALSSYALALKNIYPTSREYLEYKRVFGDDG